MQLNTDELVLKIVVEDDVNDRDGEKKCAEAHAGSFNGEQRHYRRVRRVPVGRRTLVTHRAQFVVNHFEAEAQKSF